MQLWYNKIINNSLQAKAHLQFPCNFRYLNSQAHTNIQAFTKNVGQKMWEYIFFGRKRKPEFLEKAQLHWKQKLAFVVFYYV